MYIYIYIYVYLCLLYLYISRYLDIHIGIHIHIHIDILDCLLSESKIFVEVFKLTLECYEGCQLNSGPNLIFY